MRAAPALHIDVERFGVTRVVLTALLLPAAGALAGWLYATREALEPRHAVLAVTAALALVAAATQLRFKPFRLGWDGQCWQLGPMPPAHGEPWSGRVDVALDFGGWLLLRFHREAAARRRASRWLTVQRRGLEAPWHALRCAVYCARPDRPSPLESAPPRAPTPTNEP